MDDNNMYDNWSEIIAIMKTVINHGGSRAELRIAVESTLRTLGWRATTGSMKSKRVRDATLLSIFQFFTFAARI